MAKQNKANAPSASASLSRKELRTQKKKAKKERNNQFYLKKHQKIREISQLKRNTEKNTKRQSSTKDQT